MRTMMLVATALAAAAFLPAAPVRAQQMDPDQARAKELVLRIRKSMREIDTLLLKGSQPEEIEKELAANQKRIEELLKETESKSQSVLQAMDELIKLAKYQKNPQGGPPPPPSGGEGSSGGKQPKREKSQDPGELQPQPQPQDDPSGGNPNEPKDEKGEQKDEPKDGDPKSGRPDQSLPEQNDASRDPPKGASGEFERADTSGRWGMLPPKEAEDLQRRNADEFPQRYRRWMELYFQRVNRLPARDR